MIKKKLPLVSIVTVNYNGKKLLNDCFRSLLNLNYPKNKLEIFMVDNGSTDGSIDYIRNKFSSVDIILNNENNYAKANNLGIEKAKGEYIALINNDVKVDKDWLIKLIDVIEKDKNIGAVGSKILFMDKSIQSVGHQEYPNFYWGDMGFKEKDTEQYRNLVEVTSICGCSVLYRRKCLKEVGSLDEDFNLFMEDVDMAIRCRKKGWKLLTCPQSVIYHKFHSSIGSEYNARYWQETNRLLLIAKHWPDKLSETLAGREYFTVKNGFSSPKDISEVLGKVFTKLIKEHGFELTNKLSSNLFHEVRKIYNFEKSSLIYAIKEKETSITLINQQMFSLKQQLEQEISSREKELSNLKQLMEEEISNRDQQLSSQKQSLEQEISSREKELSNLKQLMEEEISNRDQQLSSQKEQFQQEISSLKQQLAQLEEQRNGEIAAKVQELRLKDEQLMSLQHNLEHIKQQKELEISAQDRALASLRKELLSREEQINSIKQDIKSLKELYAKEIAYKEQELNQLIHDKEAEINCYRFNLQQVKNELGNIYSSTGYRRILKPLWDFLWPLKQKFKRIKLNIKTFHYNSNFGLKDRSKWTAKKIPKVFSKINEIYFLLLNWDNWKTTYFNHIKYKTFPPRPKRLTLMLTSLCNFKCIFCDVPERGYDKKELSKEEAIKIIDSAARLGIEQLDITGGEPLLHKDIFEIISYSISSGLKVTLSTNGALIRKHLVKIMASDIFCITVSVDGFIDTYNYLRNCSEIYYEIIDSLEYLKKRNKRIAVSFVVTNKNIHELEKLYNFFKEKEIFFAFFPVINKPDLYLRSHNDKKIFMNFVNKLRKKKEISLVQYKYYINMIKYYNNGIGRVRCLGLYREFGVDTNGDLFPCCVWENKDRPIGSLGNLLNDDIEELWYSDTIYEARKKIFTEGCGGCYNPDICSFSDLTGLDFFLNTSPGAKGKNLISRPVNKTKPSQVHMRLTLRCNLSCRHCDIWKTKDNKPELNTQEWKTIISKIYDWLGPFKLELAGGEIFLRADIVDIIQYASEKGVTSNITTNAMAVDKDLARKIIEAGLRAVTISLDGYQSQTHNYIRNNQNAYKIVMENANYFSLHKEKKWPFDINLATVITDRNLDELENLAKLTKNGIFSSITFQSLDNNFHAPYHPLWFKNNEFWPKDSVRTNKAMNTLISLKCKGYAINNSFEQLRAMKEYFNNPLKAGFSTCSTGDKNFIVNEKGQVLLCWNMPPVANLLDEAPENIWNDELSKKRRQEITKCKRTCRLLNCNYLAD